MSFFGHFKNPFGKFVLVFDYCTRQSGGVVGGFYLKFEFLINIYLKCNNYNKASCD